MSKSDKVFATVAGFSISESQLLWVVGVILMIVALVLVRAFAGWLVSSVSKKSALNNEVLVVSRPETNAAPAPVQQTTTPTTPVATQAPVTTSQSSGASDTPHDLLADTSDRRRSLYDYVTPDTIHADVMKQTLNNDYPYQSLKPNPQLVGQAPLTTPPVTATPVQQTVQVTQPAVPVTTVPVVVPPTSEATLPATVITQTTPVVIPATPNVAPTAPIAAPTTQPPVVIDSPEKTLTAFEFSSMPDTQLPPLPTAIVPPVVAAVTPTIPAEPILAPAVQLPTIAPEQPIIQQSKAPAATTLPPVVQPPVIAEPTTKPIEPVTLPPLIQKPMTVPVQTPVISTPKIQPIEIPLPQKVTLPPIEPLLPMTPPPQVTPVIPPVAVEPPVLPPLPTAQPAVTTPVPQQPAPSAAYSPTSPWLP